MQDADFIRSIFRSATLAVLPVLFKKRSALYLVDQENQIADHVAERRIPPNIAETRQPRDGIDHFGRFGAPARVAQVCADRECSTYRAALFGSWFITRALNCFRSSM
jgi:hypothetical protein